MSWKFIGDRPIYLQIMEKIQLDIVRGVHRPGEKMPAVRELAAEASVNPNTMQKALAELERSGLIITQRTSGRFITEDTEMIQTIRSRLANSQISSYLQGMRKIGYSDSDSLQALSSAILQERGEQDG